MYFEVCQCVCARLETLIFKLEVLDHKARERAGVITPTLASPIPVLLQLDVATEVMCVLTSFFTSPVLSMLLSYVTSVVAF